METTVTPINISRQTLEAAVVVATSKNGEVFDMLSSAISDTYSTFSALVLNEVGRKAVEEDNNSELLALVKSYVCRRAFYDNARQLDLVMTASGFGVVSATDLAPASKVRVDAMLANVERLSMMDFSLILPRLFKLHGWFEASHMKLSVINTYFDYSNICGYDHSTIEDFKAAQPLLVEGEQILRSRISDAQFDAFIKAVATNSATDVVKRAIDKVRFWLVLHLKGDKAAERFAYNQLSTIMEDNIEAFSEYKNSKEYKANHYEIYKNTKESGVYIF